MMDAQSLPENESGTSGRWRGPWRPLWLALAWLLLILVLATVAGALTGIAFDRLTGVDGPRAYAVGDLQALTTKRLAAVLFAFQATVGAGVLMAARRYDRLGLELLPLVLPKSGIKWFVLSVAGLFLISALYGGAVYQFDRSGMSQDLGPFAEMMRTDAWWLVLAAAGIGAPIAEEFLFRGLLYGFLREAPSGKVLAGILTAAAWATLHINYAIYGIVAIFLIGLYFAWLREASRSLLPPLVCHAVYNSLIVLALRASPEFAAAAG